MLSVLKAWQLNNRWIHLKCSSTDCHCVYKTSRWVLRSILQKCKRLPPSFPRFLIQTTAMSKRVFNFVLKPTGISRTPCTYTFCLRNSSKTSSMQKNEVSSHRSKLSGLWQVLYSRTQFRKPIMHRNAPHCWFYNKKIRKKHKLLIKCISLGKRNTPIEQHSDSLKVSS